MIPISWASRLTEFNVSVRRTFLILLGVIGLVAFNASSAAMVVELGTSGWKVLKGLGIIMIGVAAIALLIARPNEDSTQSISYDPNTKQDEMPSIIARARAKCARLLRAKHRDVGSPWVFKVKRQRLDETRS